MNSMFTSFGNILGPVIGGMLFDIDLDYPFYIGGVCLILGIALTYRWKPVETQPSETQHTLAEKALNK